MQISRREAIDIFRALRFMHVEVWTNDRLQKMLGALGNLESENHRAIRENIERTLKANKENVLVEVVNEQG